MLRLHEGMCIRGHDVAAKRRHAGCDRRWTQVSRERNRRPDLRLEARRRLTGLAVSNEDWDSDTTRRWEGVAPRTVESFLLSCTFRLVAMVLEPDFHLGWCQSDDGSEVLALWGRQVPNK